MELQAHAADNELIARAHHHVNQAPGQPDTTPPVLLRGEVDRTTLTYYFSEALNEDVVGGYFLVHRQPSHRQGASYRAGGEVEISGNKVRVGLGHGSVILKGELVISKYHKPYEPGVKALQDLAGNEVSTQNSIRMHNLLGPLPLLESASVNHHRLTLTLDDTIPWYSGVPVADAFTVKAGTAELSPVDVKSVFLDGTTVTLTLASAVAAGDVVEVSYDKPWRNALRNLFSELASFGEPVRYELDRGGARGDEGGDHVVRRRRQHLRPGRHYPGGADLQRGGGPSTPPAARRASRSRWTRPGGSSGRTTPAAVARTP